jgi:membrane-bound ClpP family serine protease
MAEKAPEKRYLKLNMEGWDFVGLLMVLLGTVILTVEYGGPSFTLVDYVGMGLVILGFLIFLVGSWIRPQWN